MHSAALGRHNTHDSKLDAILDALEDIRGLLEDQKHEREAQILAIKASRLYRILRRLCWSPYLASQPRSAYNAVKVREVDVWASAIYFVPESNFMT
jgi:hypothetical protein